VLDLFCGLGNFSLPLARQVGETGFVIGVDQGKPVPEFYTPDPTPAPIPVAPKPPAGPSATTIAIQNE
jgi:hypothetical protein